MHSIEQIRLLDNVSVPQSLLIDVTNDTDEFINLKTELNNSTPQLFGVAYRQGGRLHFATGMSIRDYDKMVRIDQATAGSTLEEVRDRYNRPKEAAHGKDIGKYLDETACEGLPFIFPAFLVNYGLGWTDEVPKAKLVIYAASMESLVWPAIFRPPATGGLPVTDGGHRSDELRKKLGSSSCGRLGENAISVIFVFEDDMDMYHQDFADCAKAKAMAKSLTASWDRRDTGRKFGTDLVTLNVHLRKLIDATSNSVNLSNNSTKAWSMSALHSALASCYKNEVRTSDNTYDPRRISDYFDSLFTEIPILAAITNGESPASYRKTNPDRGGCVLLRGAGLSVLTLGYEHALAKGIGFSQVAKKLGALDWYVLKADAPAQGPNEDAHTYIGHAASDLWKSMLVMMAGDRKFRLKGTRDAAAISFKAICAEVKL